MFGVSDGEIDGAAAEVFADVRERVGAPKHWLFLPDHARTLQRGLLELLSKHGLRLSRLPLPGSRSVGEGVVTRRHVGIVVAHVGERT